MAAGPPGRLGYGRSRAVASFAYFPHRGIGVVQAIRILEGEVEFDQGMVDGRGWGGGGASSPTTAVEPPTHARCRCRGSHRPTRAEHVVALRGAQVEVAPVRQASRTQRPPMGPCWQALSPGDPCCCMS